MDAATYDALRIWDTDDPRSMININDPDFQHSSDDGGYTLPAAVTLRAAGVPVGTVTPTVLADCRAFPGAAHHIWTYVPAQYDGSSPANLMVWLDGGGFAGYRRDESSGEYVVSSDSEWSVPIVLDNMIAAGDIPPTIAVFVTPGQNDAFNAANPKTNQRSVEYDTVSDLNSAFLLEEVLAPIEAEYRITTDPARRCVCGLSSGGIAAFSVGWFATARFGCVISWIGSFTNIR